jgi:hypothetical protein
VEGGGDGVTTDAVNCAVVTEDEMWKGGGVDCSTAELRKALELRLLPP